MDNEFSSWFTHDGGPCPLPVGTIVIRENQKTRPGARITITGYATKLLEDNHETFVILSPVYPTQKTGPNSWDWRYFGTIGPNGLTLPKTIRYRVKKSPSVKLLEKLVSDPPSELIEDKQLETV